MPGFFIFNHTFPPIWWEWNSYLQSIMPLQLEIKSITELNKKNNKVKYIPQEYRVKKHAVDNSCIEFKVGDVFRIIEIDGDAVLIELNNFDENPYVVSGRFLKDISDFASIE